MKILKSFFPGRFEDAHVYMERLVLLTEDRSIRVLSLNQIVNQLEQRYPDLAPIPTLMFSRNDYIATAPFKLLMRNYATAESFLTVLNGFPQPFIEFESKDVQLEDLRLQLNSRVLLDTVLYNKRMYIGADDGFYHVDLTLSTDGTSSIDGRPEKRLDARCVRALAGYGGVTASCGNDGLWTALNDFHLPDYPFRKDMSKTALQSLRATWLDHALVNYPTYSTPELHHSSYARPEYTRFEDRDRTIVTHIDNQSLDLVYLFEPLTAKYNVRHESIQYSFNSNNAVFVNTFDGQFYAVGLKHKSKTDRPAFEYARYYKRSQNNVNARVLGAAPVAGGEVIETEDQVLLFAKKKWFLVEDSEVLSVRTFRKSRRYQNIVAITKEDGVLLVGLFDESEYIPASIRKQIPSLR